jgi:hypothetical protein
MMQFTFNRNNPTNENNLYRMHFGKTQRQSLNQLTKSVPTKNEVVVSEVKEEKKMTWGEPIWFLFHTLAQKVKPDSFPIVRTELLNTIYSICANLPCPICTNHAVEYMNKINFNTIQNKEDLIKMLFIFHNEVNKRKNVPLFDYDEVEKKYSLAVTTNIIHNFFYKYDVKSKNLRMLANDFQKKKLISKLKVWFSANIQHFEK